MVDSGAIGAPEGTKVITENGVYDVSSFASADVNVAQSGGDNPWQGTIVVMNNRATNTISVYYFDPTSPYIARIQNINAGESAEIKAPMNSSGEHAYLMGFIYFDNAYSGTVSEGNNTTITQFSPTPGKKYVYVTSASGTNTAVVTYSD